MRNRLARKSVKVRNYVQRRAEDLKSLNEQRAELVQEMKSLAETAETEKRAMSEEEDSRFNELDEKVKALDATIAKVERARDLKLNTVSNEKKEELKKEEVEERVFETFIRKTCGGEIIEERAGEQNLTMGNNGAIIPTTIANRIINTVKDICPIFARATRYSVNGTLKVPVWGLANGTHDITVGYQEEFTELTADSGKFTSIDLSGYLVGALVLIGKSVANNAAVDVVSFVVAEMARKISEFIEGELLNGTGTKAAEGALNTKNVKTASSATAITSDELIEVQAGIKQVFQKNACWIMNPATFTSIRKLKDGNGRYLLQDDITGEFPYRLLGKPVFLSDNMPNMVAGNKALLYGDLSGLSVNMRENIQIQILLEKYATKHAVGFVAWFEFDSKVTDSQKLVALQMKSAA